VEPSAQNLALQSQTFDVSGTWTSVTGGTGALPSVTANAVVSPDGTQNAETVLLNRGANNTSSDQSTLQQNVTLATSGTYTFSVYAKATASGDVGKQIFLRIGSGGSLVAYTLTANWVRLTRTETGLASGSTLTQIGNRGGVTADNSVSVDLWGAQVETGTIATSYIPTTAAAVTRNADVITLSGAVSGCIGQTEGTIYFEVEVTDEARDKWICSIDSSVNSFIQIALNANRTILVSSLNAGSTVISSLISSALSVGYHKVAFAYNTAASGCIMYIDGAQNPVAVRTVTGSGLPALNNFSLGNFRTSASDNLKARIRAAALYTTRLTDTELAALTQL
jgi:hypothetical protein